MTPAWRRLMGLIRLGKWVGLCVCLLIAILIVLSAFVHARVVWARGSVLLAHGVLTIERTSTTQTTGLFAASPACCPYSWRDRLGFVLPDTESTMTRSVGLIVPRGARFRIPPLAWIHPLWDLLLIAAWPTAFLWLADGPVWRNHRIRQRARSASFAAALTAISTAVLLAASMRWRLWLVHQPHWTLTVESGAAILLVTTPTPGLQSMNRAWTSEFDNVVDFDSRDLVRHIELGSLSMGARPAYCTWDLWLPFAYVDDLCWCATIALWPTILLFAGPAVYLFIRTRSPSPGMCERCGYSLNGNVSGVCPVCGTAVTEAVREAVT